MLLNIWEFGASRLTQGGTVVTCCNEMTLSTYRELEIKQYLGTVCELRHEVNHLQCYLLRRWCECGSVSKSRADRSVTNEFYKLNVYINSH
jgi:hypothetical protein